MSMREYGRHIQKMVEYLLTIEDREKRQQQAQVVGRPRGEVSVFADWFPNRRDTTELRARVFAEERIVPSERVHITLSGFAEGLLARRPQEVSSVLESERTSIARVHEATANVRLGRMDLYAGFGRIVWGRLDELQPTDVINPLDVSRFFFEGRNEARLPVALARGRLYLSDDVSLEAVYVPVFRGGKFDQLAEESSPFNLATASDALVCLAIGCPVIPVRVRDAEPSTRWGNAQGGMRFTATSGRVDWSVSAYRGFEPFPFAELIPATATIVSTRPRFTMLGADFESVRGEWGVRGEVAAFVRDSFQGGDLSVVRGQSFDGGVGVDRRAGNYHVTGTILFHREEPDTPGLPFEARSDVTLIVSADRTFAMERYRTRAFTVYNPSEGSAFLRLIAMATLRDDLALEASGGWFPGEGRDTIGRFSDSDFLYARMKVFW